MSNSNRDIERSSTTAIEQDVGKLSETPHLSKRFRWTNPSFDDLPEDVFSQILRRLSCHKQLVQCKCVSKLWHRRLSFMICDSNFIRRFIRHKHDSKTPIVRDLLSSEGNEFRVTKVTTVKMIAEELISGLIMEVEKSLTLTLKDQLLLAQLTKTLEQSFGELSSKPLAPLFKSLMMSRYGKEKEPVVVATYNDLVLCQHRKHDYYICNPYTRKFVALPRAPPSVEFQDMVIGFICDDLENSGSRCRVVRIPRTFGDIQTVTSSNLKVEIFSSETGVWRRSLISFSQQIYPVLINSITYPYNGMLYWETDHKNFLGFDPFMINHSSSDGDDIMDHYQGRIIEFGDKKYANNIKCAACAGMCGGRLRFFGVFKLCKLLVWELEEEEDERAHDRSGKLVLKCTSYSWDITSLGIQTWRDQWVVFDPNDKNILYLHSGSDIPSIFRSNIRTREWSTVSYPSCGRNYLFQLTVLPWWPTPVPKIQKRKYNKSKTQSYN